VVRNSKQNNQSRPCPRYIRGIERDENVSITWHLWQQGSSLRRRSVIRLWDVLNVAQQARPADNASRFHEMDDPACYMAHASPAPRLSHTFSRTVAERHSAEVLQGTGSGLRSEIKTNNQKL
jgi:hypothetical protein